MERNNLDPNILIGGVVNTDLENAAKGLYQSVESFTKARFTRKEAINIVMGIITSNNKFA